MKLSLTSIWSHQVNFCGKSLVGYEDVWRDDLTPWKACGKWQGKVSFHELCSKCAPPEHTSVTVSSICTDVDVGELVLGITSSHQDEAEVAFVVVEGTSTLGWCFDLDMFAIYSPDTVRKVPILPESRLLS